MRLSSPNNAFVRRRFNAARATFPGERDTNICRCRSLHGDDAPSYRPANSFNRDITMALKEQRNAASAAVHYPLTSCLKKILERCCTRAARTYGARNPSLSPIATSPAGTGSDKASYSHYDVIGD